MIQCGICLEIFREDDTCSAGPCGHTFHSGCWEEWLIRSGTCPFCHEFCSVTRLTRIYFCSSGDDNLEERFDDLMVDLVSTRSKLDEMREQHIIQVENERKFRAETEEKQEQINQLKTQLELTLQELRSTRLLNQSKLSEAAATPLISLPGAPSPRPGTSATGEPATQSDVTADRRAASGRVKARSSASLPVAARTVVAGRAVSDRAAAGRAAAGRAVADRAASRAATAGRAVADRAAARFAAARLAASPPVPARPAAARPAAAPPVPARPKKTRSTAAHPTSVRPIAARPAAALPVDARPAAV